MEAIVCHQPIVTDTNSHYGRQKLTSALSSASPSAISSFVFDVRGVCPIVRQVHPRGFPDADASVAPASGARLTKLQYVPQAQTISCLPL